MSAVTDVMFSGEALLTFRRRAGVTQSEMATAMGMPLRSYQDIEKGPNPVRPVHVQAAKMALLELAADKDDSVMLTDELEYLIRKLHSMLPDENPAS